MQRPKKLPLLFTFCSVALQPTKWIRPLPLFTMHWRGPLRWPGVAIETPSLHFLEKMNKAFCIAIVLKYNLNQHRFSFENLKAMLKAPPNIESEKVKNL